LPPKPEEGQGEIPAIGAKSWGFACHAAWSASCLARCPTLVRHPTHQGDVPGDEAPREALCVTGRLASERIRIGLSLQWADPRQDVACAS
jgi:hypothetical protein